MSAPHSETHKHLPALIPEQFLPVEAYDGAVSRIEIRIHLAPAQPVHVRVRPYSLRSSGIDFQHPFLSAEKHQGTVGHSRRAVPLPVIIGRIFHAQGEYGGVLGRSDSVPAGRGAPVLAETSGGIGSPAVIIRAGQRCRQKESNQ